MKRSEEDLLLSFSNFIDKNFIVNSHEKRGVAYHLLVEIVKCVPIGSFSICISKRMIKSLVSARINKKHTLHVVAESTLKSLVEAVSDDNKARLLMASMLVQHGGANFDQRTKTKTIQNLLEGLSETEIISHVKQLCQLLRNYITQSDKDQILESTNADNTDGEMTSVEVDPNIEKDEVQEHDTHTVQGIIDALVSLSKNSNILGRFHVTVITGLVLLRITYFSECVSSKDILNATQKRRQSVSKKNKKSTSDDESQILELANDIFGQSNMHDNKEILQVSLQCLDIINGKDTVDVDGSDESAVTAVTYFSKEVQNYSSVKYHSLISETGHKNYSQLSTLTNQKNDSNTVVVTKDSTTHQTGYSVLQIFTNFTEKLMDSGSVFSITTTNRSDKNEDVAFDPKETLKAIKLALDYQKKLKKYLKSEEIVSRHLSEKDMIKFTQLCDSLISFISYAIFNILYGENNELETLEDVGAICYDLITYQTNKNDHNNNDVDDNDLEHPQIRLFELTMDFLSVGDDQSIRGIRDSIKKVWIHTSSIFPIIDEVVDSILSVITNDNDDEDDQRNDTQDDDEEEDADEEEDEEKEDHNDKNMKDDDEDEDNNNDEVNHDKSDILITEDNMFDMLEDDDQDLDMSDMIVHEGTPEQDAALVQLIELRKKSRKLGLLNAQKHQFLIRTRAVDILDIIVNHFSSDRLMFMIPTFLKTLKSVYSSSTLMSVQECLSFCNKLKSLIEDKICKGKQQQQKKKVNDTDLSVAFGDSVTSATTETSTHMWITSKEDVENVLNEILICIKSPIAPMKHVASNCLFRVCKTVLSERSMDVTDIIELLNTQVIGILEDFKSKKNSKVPRKLFEDLFVRFPDFSVSCLLKPLIIGCSGSKSIYIQTECCDLLSTVFCRYKSLSTDSQVIILKNTSTCLNELSNVVDTLLKQIKQESNLSNVCGKRLKAFIACGKHLLFSLKLSNHKFSKSDIQSMQLFVSKVNSISTVIKDIFGNNKAPNVNLMASIESTVKSVNQIDMESFKSVEKSSDQSSLASNKKRSKVALNNDDSNNGSSSHKKKSKK